MPLSSIVISDEPLSSETNYRTEFVAVLSNQPQGGFITRMPSPSTAIARAGQDDSGSGFGWSGSPGYAQPQYGQPRRAQSYYYPQRDFWGR
jgi:hypothetical protein